MKTVTLGEQVTMDGERVPVRINRFTVPIEALRAEIEHTRVECWACEAERTPRAMIKVEVFDDPWSEAGSAVYVCRYSAPDSRYVDSCYDALTDPGVTDFGYFDCESCQRLVIVRCPSNGWHSYQREIGDGENVWGVECLACYERELFERGCKREAFEAGKIPGMFCDPSELRAHGFEVVDGYEDQRVDGDRARAFCDEAIRMIDAGQLVIVDYERLSIVGDEGYVTLWAKPVPSTPI